MADNGSLSLSSKLQYTFIVAPGDEDDDEIKSPIAGQEWGSTGG